MNLSSMKVSSRLYLGFGLILVFLLGIALFSYSRLSALNDNVEFLVSDRYAKTVLVDSISDNVNLIARAVRNAVLSTDETITAQELDRIKKAREESAATLQKLSDVISSSKGKELMATLKQSSAEYYVEQENLLALVAKGNTDAAKTLVFGAMRTKQSAMFAALRKLSAYQRGLMDDTVAESQETYHHACVLLIIVSSAAFGLSLIAALLITRSIIRQLGGEPDYVMSIASDIASGNLARSITIRQGDQTSRIASVRVMRNRLADIVGQVRAGTDMIATASSQIASGNLDLSSRTEQQASSLEETASAMEELTSTVKQNADNARQANQLAVSASEVAIAGGNVVSQVVETMGSINASSKKIVDIISVIDGIAFQTNILALNAAVEAARAGEQGRGFAVVATEVRNLAQRSATAAKEIKSLIDNSVTQVDTGSKLVAQAGSTMNEVVNSVKRVTDIVGEITSASQEQSDGIEQINLAITQMDEATQQNAALVEEAAAAAQSMQEQASKLSEVVSIFKLDPKKSEGQAQALSGNERVRHIVPVSSKLAPATPTKKPALSIVQGDDSNSWEQF